MLPVLALGLAVLTACGASEGSAGGERACTMIGAMPGISLDVAPRPDVAGAEVTACWGADCRSWRPDLHRATAAEPQGCTGTGPDDSCSARVVESGGWYAFVDVADLREGPVEITVVLTDGSGAELDRTTQTTAAQLVYPNGPDCGGGVPQATVQV